MSLDCLQVAAYVPESALYTQLQKYKRKTDAYLLQKQSEVQDALRRPHPVAKKLCLLCTTHMPTKRPLPHLQVARQTSLLNECIGSTQAARIADWAPSLVYLLRFDASMRASTLVNHLRICWSRH